MARYVVKVPRSGGDKYTDGRGDVTSDKAKAFVFDDADARAPWGAREWAFGHRDECGFKGAYVVRLVSKFKTYA